LLPSSLLFNFLLEIELKNKVIDYEKFSKILLSKGFADTGRDIVAKESGLSVLPIDNTEKNVVRWIDQGSYTTPKYYRTQLGISLGRIQILSAPFQNTRTTIIMGLRLDSDPFQDPQGLAHNIEDATFVINTVLTRYFELDPRKDMSSITLQLGYKVSAIKSAPRVLQLIEKLPNSSELTQFIGRKIKNTLRVFPIRNDRTLTPIGLIEANISCMSDSNYNVQYTFSLSSVDAVSDFLKIGEEKSSLLISDLENSVMI